MQNDIIAVEGYHERFESENRSLRDCTRAREQLQDTGLDGQHYRDNIRRP